MNILTQNPSPEQLVKIVLDTLSESNVGGLVTTIRRSRDTGQISTGAYYLAVYTLADYLHSNTVITNPGDQRFHREIKFLSPELYEALDSREAETEALMESAYESLYGQPCKLFKDDSALPEAA